jgi:hypothetical protein
VSPLLGGPARLRPFAPALHLHQRKSSRNLHLQTEPRVSTHHVVNHSSHQGATIHWSLDAPVLTCPSRHRQGRRWGGREEPEPRWEKGPRNEEPSRRRLRLCHSCSVGVSRAGFPHARVDSILLFFILIIFHLSVDRTSSQTI